MRPIAVLAAAALLLAAAPASAQSVPCTDRSDIVKKLAKAYSETPTAVGVTSDGSLIEVLTSRDGHSWTLILTLPNGMACPVAEGEDWQTMPQVAQSGPEL